MRLTLRHRILLTLVPLVLLLAALGGAGVVLLYRLGHQIDAILRENYDSVIAMERLNEALERIDSSFQFALAGRRAQAQEQYQRNWEPYLRNLRVEQSNITLPGEQELADRLTALTERYRGQGDKFFGQPPDMAPAVQDYFGPDGLLARFNDIKAVSGSILRLNQDNMETASQEARRTALYSLIGFAAGLAAAVVLASVLAWHTTRAILRPIQALTQAATGISAGNLDQVVPYLSRDELGDLAQAFNTMARHLRDYRRSELSRLLTAQRTSQATIDSFSDPVLVVDAEERVEMANPAARHALGVPTAQTAAARRGADEARPVWQPPDALREPLRAAIREHRAYQPQDFDRAMKLRVGGEDRFYLPRIVPIEDPYKNSLGAAVLLQDITRFRLLDEVKSDLVATVSHELKTPLTGVQLAVHLLLEETVGPLAPKQMELLIDARDNAERLLARVNNLLDLTRLERGRVQLDLRPQAPAELLRVAADGVRDRARDKGVEVMVETTWDLPPIAADPQRLPRALDNLLDNAVSYTERGGRITLSASAADGQVTLTVADTGLGIPPEHLPHVFDRFFRVPGRSRAGGTGLGLAIVREIVTAHGGTVACESRPGQGSIFRLTLPVWSEPERAEAKGRQEEIHHDD
jgi:signal transduction histidine kinase